MYSLPLPVSKLGITSTVLIYHQFEQEQMEDDNKSNDADPKDSWKTTPLVTMTMKCNDMVFVTGSCDK